MKVVTQDDAIQIIKNTGFDDNFAKDLVNAFIAKEGEKKLEKNVNEFLKQLPPIIQYYKK